MLKLFLKWQSMYNLKGSWISDAIRNIILVQVPFYHSVAKVCITYLISITVTVWWLAIKSDCITLTTFYGISDVFILGIVHLVMKKHLRCFFATKTSEWVIYSNDVNSINGYIVLYKYFLVFSLN